jgi:hypothetical protein
MQGGKGADAWGMPGGRLSLGKIRNGSGYCVGSVVETRMGEATSQNLLAGRGKGRHGGSTAPAAAGLIDAGNGLKDVWVLGEDFLRGVSAVFDVSHSIRLW